MCLTIIHNSKERQNSQIHLNDSMESNESAQRTPHSTSEIQETPMKVKHFVCVTSLDSTVEHHHVEWHPEAKKLCPFVFLWGKHEMQVLPTRLCNGLSVFQEKMSTSLVVEVDSERTDFDDPPGTAKDLG